MKLKTNNSSVPWKIKGTLAKFLGQIVAGGLAFLAFSAPAAVQVTRFDPPLQISAYAEPTGDSFFGTLAADLDANDSVDFRLEYGNGDMSAFFNSPTRFAQRVSQPNVGGMGGPLAGVPLGSTIGSNIVSSVATNFYAWSSGYTNRDDLTAPLGDHETTVIIANLVTYNAMSSFVPINTNGFTTNIIFPQPIISGDVTFKEAVMALEFYIDGQRHYGYIHFNFSGGAGGAIYGWAYETEPNVPIEASSLAPSPVAMPFADHSGIAGVVDQGNLLGWSVLVSSPNRQLVTNVPTDADGFFKADLKPGRYLLRPINGSLTQPVQPFPTFPLVGPAKSIVIRRSHFTFVTLPTSGKNLDLPNH